MALSQLELGDDSLEAHRVVCRGEVVCPVLLSSSSIVGLLLSDALGPLGAVGRVAERLTLLNLLVEVRQWVLHVVGRLLLVKWGHPKFLVDQCLVLAAGWSVAIVSVIPICRVVQISQVRHHSVDATQESFVLLNNVELIAATAEASDCLS